MLRHIQKKGTLLDSDLSSPVSGNYLNALHSFRRQKRRKAQAIDRRYCHCQSQVSFSLAANLAIGSLSLPRPSMTSGRPDVVGAFVYEHTVSHYGIVHKPCRIIDSLVQHIRSVSVCREGPCQFHSKEHPVYVLDTVWSWISGLTGSIPLSSWFI